MRARLIRTLYRLEALDRPDAPEGPLQRVDPRAHLLVTLVYLVVLLTLPAERLPDLLLLAAGPIGLTIVGGGSYAALFRQSLAVLPFVLFIGIFHPLLQREPLFRIGPVVVSRGWCLLALLLVRSLLAVQALLLLFRHTGIHRLCRALRQLGVPELFTTQLLFVHRYLRVLLQESIALSAAREARSFGRRRWPLRMWGGLICQLLLRTFDRALRIGEAMAARGFTGSMPDRPGQRTRWRPADTLYAAAGSALPVLLCLCPVAQLFHP